MENGSATKQLLHQYYKGLAQQKGWQEALSDDFSFLGGDMTKMEPLRGKQAYEQVIERFSRLFQGVQVKEMIVQGQQAYVTANYDFIFPNGVRRSGDVAEIWTAADGKLTSLRIFFDTLTFAQNTPK